MINTYDLIYADPPWEQKAGRPLSGGYLKSDGKQLFNPKSNSSENLPYSTMSFQDIKEMPVNTIASKNSHLFMWATNKYLLQANEVISAWGFKYSTTLVWCKKPIGGGLGGTFKVSTEFLLYARRGRPESKTNFNGTWFDVKRQYVGGYPCHSKKPNFFRDLVAQVCDGNKLEMFARENHEGWDVFGNEVENSIIL